MMPTHLSRLVTSCAVLVAAAVCLSQAASCAVDVSSAPDPDAETGVDTTTTDADAGADADLGGSDTPTASGDGSLDDSGDSSGGAGGADSGPGGCDCDLVGDACNVATCDPATGACTLAPAEAGTRCGDSTDDACTAPDTCDGAGACVPHHAEAGAPCGDPGSACVLADSCDGTGACVPGALAAEGAPCGDPDATECSSPDSCDAQGVCQANHMPLGAACGQVAGGCALGGTCDGGGTCDPGGLLPAGSACGDPTDDACTAPDTCDDAGTCLPNHIDAGAPCGDPGDACVLADACDGQGLCADAGFAPDGASCGDGAVTDCTGADTCAAGVCVANDAAAGSPCGDAGSVCLLADTCDGAGACIDQGAAPAGTPCGSDAVSECSGADTCDGAGVCSANHAPAGTACGDPATECVNGDTCDGSGQCKDKGFAAIGAPCGDLSDTPCSNPDACNGAGTCLPHHAPLGLQCGDAASACAAADACDGQGQCADGVATPAGAPCGDPTDSPCTNPDVCDGAGACSPAHEPAGTACGVPGWACVLQDFCDGNGVCADSGFAPADTACGDPTASACTGPDGCDGDGVCLTHDEAAGTSCGEPGTDCAPGDACDGAGTCKAVDLAPPGAPCGDPTDNACTAPDTCDGAGTCLDHHAPLGSSCGHFASACAYADWCDGSGVCVVGGTAPAGSQCGDQATTACSGPDQCDGDGSCDPNDFEAGIACGDPSVTECSGGDVCNGLGGCSTNNAPPGTPCGDPGDECTPPDTCDGLGSCDDNGFLGAGTPCGDPALTECDNPDSCNGIGACVANKRPWGTACGVPGSQCKVADGCDGDGTCIDSGFEPAGTPCGSPQSSVCTDPDTCDGFGLCLQNHAPDGPNEVTCGQCGCESTGACSGGTELPCIPLPGASEVCDGIDNNCNCLTDEGLDEDGDGYGPVGTEGCAGGTQPDCNDLDPDISPAATEVCDGIDNDCEGGTDEGVLNACGDCVASCNFTCLGGGTGCLPFSPNPGNSSGVDTSEDGDLMLHAESLQQSVAWFAATDGTVSKVDTTTGHVTARFSLGDASPRALTVDHRGSAWVGRGGGLAGAIKIGNWTALCADAPDSCECSDLNLDGTIQTSSDLNGDGAIDETEMLGASDECIVNESVQADYGPVAGLATDADGFIWLGQVNVATVQRLTPEVGIPIADLGLETLAEGIAADDGGLVFVMRRSDGAIQPINSQAHEAGLQRLQPFSEPSGHFIAIDPYGRVWVTAGTPARGAAVYDPVFGQWTEVEFEGLSTAYGLAFGDDGTGWVTGVDASSGAWAMVKGFEVPAPGYIEPDTQLTIIKSVNVGAQCSQPHGVDIGANGFAWLACAGGTVHALSPDPASTATITRATGATGEQENRGRFTAELNELQYAAQGSYTTVIPPCPNATTLTSWGLLEFAPTVPLGPGEVIEVRVRFAASAAALGTAEWSLPFIEGFGSLIYPGELADLGGSLPFMELEIVLVNGAEGAPLLNALSISRYCE